MREMRICVRAIGVVVLAFTVFGLLAQVLIAMVIGFLMYGDWRDNVRKFLFLTWEVVGWLTILGAVMLLISSPRFTTTPLTGRP